VKIEIRQIEGDIIRITTPDERWYKKKGDVLWRPSSSWICEYLPKGIAFYKWLASTGWDEAEAIKEAAGNRGSKVHHAIERLLLGNPVTIEDRFQDSNGEEAELTVEEWECLLGFQNWFIEARPKVIATEQTVFNDEEWYAGTLDLIAKIDDQVYIIDFKTSQNIHLSHQAQLSSYLHCDGIKADKLGILQIGYRRNKSLYKFTEIPDRFDLFLAAKTIWANENEGKQPPQREYPRIIKLGGQNGSLRQ